MWKDRELNLLSENEDIQNCSQLWKRKIANHMEYKKQFWLAQITWISNSMKNKSMDIMKCQIKFDTSVPAPLYVLGTLIL